MGIGQNKKANLNRGLPFFTECLPNEFKIITNWNHSYLMVEAAGVEPAAF